MKPDLVNLPFIRELEYGTQMEGYWTYDRMILQLEDCIDCLAVLFPHCEYLFLFDHSNGHDRQREDALNPNKMNKEWGGSQPKMRDTKIEVEAPFDAPKYPKGSTQSLVFQHDDEGPFYLSLEEREARKFDRNTGISKERNLKKSELLERLQEKGIVSKGSTKQLRDLCLERNLQITEKVEVIEEGWMGKPKGIMQVLWERGFLDPTKISTYTMEGKKDLFGNLIEGSSLREIIRQQPDFAQEETLLEYNGRNLGVTILKTPKCHPELAGEGIEYFWALAKANYRKLPIKNKRGREKFLASVRHSLGPSKLTRVIAQKISKRARQYILAYKCMHERDQNRSDKDSNTSSDDLDNQLTENMSFSLIQKVVKTFKTHRSAADFDCGYVKEIVCAMRQHN